MRKHNHRKALPPDGSRIFTAFVGIVIFVAPANKIGMPRNRASSAERIALEFMPQADFSTSLPYMAVLLFFTDIRKQSSHRSSSPKKSASLFSSCLLFLFFWSQYCCFYGLTPCLFLLLCKG